MQFWSLGVNLAKGKKENRGKGIAVTGQIVNFAVQGAGMPHRTYASAVAFLFGVHQAIA